MKDKWPEYQKYVLTELDRMSIIMINHAEIVIAIRERLSSIEQLNNILVDEQKQITKKLSKIEIKLAYYAGSITIILLILTNLTKILEFLKK